MLSIHPSGSPKAEKKRVTKKKEKDSTKDMQAKDPVDLAAQIQGQAEDHTNEGREDNPFNDPQARESSDGLV